MEDCDASTGRFVRGWDINTQAGGLCATVEVNPSGNMRYSIQVLVQGWCKLYPCILWFGA